MTLVRSLLVVLAVACAGCSGSSMGPSVTTFTTTFTATSVITDSVSPNACITQSLAQARRDVNVGTATLVIDGPIVTLTTNTRCPVCQTPDVTVWTGEQHADAIDLSGMDADSHASGCHVFEHPTSMTVHLMRTDNGWSGTRTNNYVLLSDTTLAPTGDTVVDTLAVTLR
jgi:hypothetical protein